MFYLNSNKNSPSFQLFTSFLSTFLFPPSFSQLRPNFSPFLSPLGPDRFLFFSLDGPASGPVRQAAPPPLSRPGASFALAATDWWAPPVRTAFYLLPSSSGTLPQALAQSTRDSRGVSPEISCVAPLYKAGTPAAFSST